VGGLREVSRIVARASREISWRAVLALRRPLSAQNVTTRSAHVTRFTQSSIVLMGHSVESSNRASRDGAAQCRRSRRSCDGLGTRTQVVRATLEFAA
jgi:hypothetical protein